MEARLVQARKKQTAGPSSFYVHKEDHGGIPVSYDLYKGMPGNCLEISQEATDFSLEIMGPKGAWNGWHLLAIGRLRNGDTGIFFDVVLARKAEVKPLLTPETDYFEMVSSPEKMASSPEKKVPSPDKMIPSSEEKVSLPQSSSHCLKPMSCGDGPYYCVVLPRKSEANPLVTPETDHFEVVSSPEKMASSSTEEMVSSPEKVVSAPEKITSAPEKQTWW